MGGSPKKRKRGGWCSNRTESCSAWRVCLQDSIGFPLGETKSFCKILRMGMINLFQWPVTVTNSLIKSCPEDTVPTRCPGRKEWEQTAGVESFLQGAPVPAFPVLPAYLGVLQGAERRRLQKPCCHYGVLCPAPSILLCWLVRKKTSDPRQAHQPLSRSKLEFWRDGKRQSLATASTCHMKSSARRGLPLSGSPEPPLVPPFSKSSCSDSLKSPGRLPVNSLPFKVMAASVSDTGNSDKLSNYK